MAYIGGLVLLAAAIFFIIHAYRNGRDRWLYIILFVPVVGVLAYLFAEYLPDMRTGRAGVPVQQISSEISRVSEPSKEYRRLKDQLEFSDTFANRLLLAEECVKTGLYGEAIELYQSSLQGVFKDDGSALLGLAHAYYLDGQYDKASETIARIYEIDENFAPGDVALLSAQVLGATGEIEAALEEYEVAIESAWGWEARCRYGLFLRELDRDGEARAVFDDILARARRASRPHRRAQRRWLETARRNLDELKATD